MAVKKNARKSTTKSKGSGGGKSSGAAARKSPAGRSAAAGTTGRNSTVKKAAKKVTAKAKPAPAAGKKTAAKAGKEADKAKAAKGPVAKKSNATSPKKTSSTATKAAATRPVTAKGGKNGNAGGKSLKSKALGNGASRSNGSSGKKSAQISGRNSTASTMNGRGNGSGAAVKEGLAAAGRADAKITTKAATAPKSSSKDPGDLKQRPATDTTAVKTAPAPAAKGPVKEKVQIEFAVRSTPHMLYELISTPSGFSEWYCDDVNVKGDEYTFMWQGEEEATTMIGRKLGEVIRFRRHDDEDENAWFEFRVRIDAMTNDVALIVTDHAWPDEVDETRNLWNTQIANLLRILGA
jgi:hypothetical protein